MLSRVELQTVQSPQLIQSKSKIFDGISADFFGAPNQMDKMNDMKMCKSLGIDATGMQRDDVKANILSKLTGQSVDDMKTFYTSCSEADMKKDMQQMQSLGLEASSQKNWIDARNENKAALVNAWMQAGTTQASNEENQTEQTQETQQTQQSQQTQGSNTNNRSNSSNSAMDSLISFLQSLGLSPSGSKEGDYAAVMAKLNQMEQEAKSDTEKQSVNSMRQSFMAIYASL